MCNNMRQALKWNCLKLISKMANRFIMSPVVLIVLTIVINQANGQGNDDDCYCPDGTTAMKGTCLKIFEDRRMYTDALKHCGTLGGTLAKLDNFDLQAVFQNISASSNAVEFWIGLDDLQVEGQFLWWKDQTVLNLSNSSFRSLNDENRDCVAMDINGSFIFLKCSDWQTFICDLPSCQLGRHNTAPDCGCYTSDHEEVYFSQERCYLKFLKKSKDTFEGAVAYCTGVRDSAGVNKSVSLPMLNPWFQIKNSLLTHEGLFNSDNDYLWIGISDKQIEGELRWTLDDTLVRDTNGYSDFNGGNTDMRDCVAVNRQSLRWEIKVPLTLLPYICEINPECDVPGSNATTWVLVAIICLLALAFLIAGSCVILLRKERRVTNDTSHKVKPATSVNDEYEDATSVQPGERLSPDGSPTIRGGIASEDIYAQADITEDLAEAQKNERASYYGEMVYKGGPDRDLTTDASPRDNIINVNEDTNGVYENELSRRNGTIIYN